MPTKEELNKILKNTHQNTPAFQCLSKKLGELRDEEEVLPEIVLSAFIGSLNIEKDRPLLTAVIAAYFPDEDSDRLVDYLQHIHEALIQCLMEKHYGQCLASRDLPAFLDNRLENTGAGSKKTYTDQSDAQNWIFSRFNPPSQAESSAEAGSSTAIPKLALQWLNTPFGIESFFIALSFNSQKTVIELLSNRYDLLNTLTQDHGVLRPLFRRLFHHIGPIKSDSDEELNIWHFCLWSDLFSTLILEEGEPFVAWVRHAGSGEAAILLKQLVEQKRHYSLNEISRKALPTVFLEAFPRELGHIVQLIWPAALGYPHHYQHFFHEQEEQVQPYYHHDFYSQHILTLDEETSIEVFEHFNQLALNDVLEPKHLAFILKLCCHEQWDLLAKLRNLETDALPEAILCIEAALEDANDRPNKIKITEAAIFTLSHFFLQIAPEHLNKKNIEDLYSKIWQCSQPIQVITVNNIGSTPLFAFIERTLKNKLPYTFIQKSLEDQRVDFALLGALLHFLDEELRADQTALFISLEAYRDEGRWLDYNAVNKTIRENLSKLEEQNIADLEPSLLYLELEKASQASRCENPFLDIMSLQEDFTLSNRPKPSRKILCELLITITYLPAEHEALKPTLFKATLKENDEALSRISEHLNLPFLGLNTEHQIEYKCGILALNLLTDQAIQEMSQQANADFSALKNQAVMEKPEKPEEWLDSVVSAFIEKHSALLTYIDKTTLEGDMLTKLKEYLEFREKLRQRNSSNFFQPENSQASSSTTQPTSQHSAGGGMDKNP